VTERKSVSKELSFEQGLEKLESIVEQMESGELPLDALMKNYEEGTQLLKRCERKIKEAEKKIEILRNKDAKAPEFEDFDPDSAS